MKRYTAYLLLAALAVTACQRNLEPSKDSSDAIRFVASVTSPATRTVYTGDGTVGWEAVDWGDGGNNTGEVVAKERIEWLSGDRISIFCPNAADAKTASYAVEGETHEEGLPSSASTSVSAVTSGSALKWNNFATHYFFGRYPDPSWSGAPSEAAFTSQSQESSYFTCVIPASQTLTREGNSYTFNPDMGYCYMTAYAESKPGYDVALLFKPAVSAFEVAVPVKYLDCDVTSVKLVSSAHRLSGTYTVKIGDTPAYTIDESSLTEADRSVVANLGSALTVTPGETLVVTLFTCPVAVAGTAEDHLSVVITFSDNQEFTLPLKHGNTWYAYEPGYKYRITSGKLVKGRRFSVSDDKLVIIAPGNLMAKISSINFPTAAASEWKFGEPTEIIGIGETEGNYLFANGSTDCVGKWVDLFSWQGESSTNDATHRAHGLVSVGYNDTAYFGNQEDESLYAGCWDGLTIVNGGNYYWHPLTSSQWTYLCDGRNCSPRCVEASIAGLNGIIIFPDDYVHPSGVAAINKADDVKGEYEDNIFDATAWNALQQAGCVFLPVTGFRNGAEMSSGRGGRYGSYWASNARGAQRAGDLWFYTEGLGIEPNALTNRFYGLAVRLVRDLN